MAHSRTYAIAIVLSLASFGMFFLLLSWMTFSDETRGDPAPATEGNPAETGSEVEIDIIENDGRLDVSLQEETEETIENDAESVSIIDETESATEEAPTEKDTTAPPSSKALPPLPAPIRKKDTDKLRIGFVTDSHVMSSENGNSRTLHKKYEERLNHFIERMNNDFGADLLIANGDIVEGTRQTSETGIRELSLVKKIFDRTSIPTYWTLGNHDLRSVTKKQWRDALGIGYEYKAFDVKQYRIFILDSNFTSTDENVAPGKSYTRGKVSKKQLEWLEKELKKTKKRAIVFMHHPPLRGIDSKIDEGLLKNALELRSVLSENGALAVFAGHIEDLYYEKADGVKYFVIPGLVKHPTYQGTFAEIVIDGGKIEVDVSYLNKNGTYRTIRMKQK